MVAVEAEPGSGVAKSATGEAAKLLDNARTSAGEGASPAEVLNALAESLPEPARAGLAKLRSVGDAHALTVLEGKTKGGQDIAHYLAGEGLTPVERTALRQRLVEARVKLARAKLIEMEIHGDPLVQEAVREHAERFARRLDEASVIDDAGYNKVKEDFAIQDLIADITESVARKQLAAEVAAEPQGKGRTILENMEIVREVPGFKTIAEWKAAQPDPAKASIGGMYEADGKVWKSLTEVDAMVVEKTAAGKLRIVEMEQVKSGKNDTPAKASKQHDSAKAGFRELLGGAKDVAIFNRTGKNTIDGNRTAEFDLSNVDAMKTTSRGLPGKGFDKSIETGVEGLDAARMRVILENLAWVLIESGLPEFWTPKVAPVTSDRSKDEE